MTRPALGVATHRLGFATLTATGVRIVLGGLVTNTGAGLAVPDWPRTFGHNMFLFPWSQMIGGIFYEHSHRLVGALVGLLTLVLSAALWGEGGRLRRLGLVAVAVVLVQGVLPALNKP
jgi:cytochrome c oxidase assembly protein subunit 15